MQLFPHIRKLTLILGVILCLHCMLTLASIPEDSHIPGGIATIVLSHASADAPEVYFYNERVITTPVPHKKNLWYAIVGLSLNLAQGRYKLTVKKPYAATQWFDVKYKNYPKSIIPIKNLRLVTPNQTDRKQIFAERDYINKIIGQWRPLHDALPLRFSLPIKTKMTGEFGIYALINGSVVTRNTGIALSARRGTKVYAAARGKVVVTGDLFLEGNTVIIAHGDNLSTQYSHMRKILVKAGETVNKRTVVGLVGSTGRTPGPQLVWSVIINNTRVNPQLFLSDADRKLLKHGHAKDGIDPAITYNPFRRKLEQEAKIKHRLDRQNKPTKK